MATPSRECYASVMPVSAYSLGFDNKKTAAVSAKAPAAAAI
jgi:hypothetical protein